MEKNPFDEEPEYEDTPETTVEQFQELVHTTFGTSDNEQHLALIDIWSVGESESDSFCADEDHVVITGEFMFGMLLVDGKLIVDKKDFHKLIPKRFYTPIPPKPILGDVRIKDAQQEMIAHLQKVVVIAVLEFVCDLENDNWDYPLDDVEELHIFRYVRKA